MRYANWYKCDISNGNNVGVSLFVQGCPFHCKGCFNSETWDFNGGKPWTKETIERFLSLAGKDYIKRVSILGGEPLADQNVQDVKDLIKTIKNVYPDKKVWVYTGFNVADILSGDNQTRKDVLNLADTIVDGRFEYDKRDLSIAFRGSRNQHIYEHDDKGNLVSKESAYDEAI